MQKLSVTSVTPTGQFNKSSFTIPVFYQANSQQGTMDLIVTLNK